MESSRDAFFILDFKSIFLGFKCLFLQWPQTNWQKNKQTKEQGAEYIQSTLSKC